MNSMPSDVSRMVFRRLIKEGLGEYSLDAKMLSILIELDGQKTVGAIAQSQGLGMDVMRRAIAKLLQLKIIEPVRRTVTTLDDAFLDFLERELSLAIGPIAMVVIEDATADLGHDMEEFPASQAAELIDYISQEIQREDRRNAFRQNMFNEIKRKGYS